MVSTASMTFLSVNLAKLLSPLFLFLNPETASKTMALQKIYSSVSLPILLIPLY